MKKAIFIIIVLILLFVVYTSIFDDQAVSFRKTIQTDATAPFVWNYISAALLDSGRISNWPNELCTVEAVELKKDEKLIFMYKSPWYNKTQVQRITDYIEGGLISYRSLPGQALAGGGQIEVKPKGKGAEVIWSGIYNYSGFPPLAFYFKHYFLERFFTRLRYVLNDLD